MSVDVVTIERADQLKALGHPLRLRVLEVLGESGEALTNRELAARLGVDPGHLHFHVRMLAAAGLIELAATRGRREKPYRAVAARVRVSPELLATGAADDARGAMLEDAQAAWARHGAGSWFRAAQLTVRIDPERVGELWQPLAEMAAELEDPAGQLVQVTIFAYPRPERDG
jgi:DNA-binding transcriptional ArsR family regulator